jgi:hypothetical protein
MIKYSNNITSKQIYLIKLLARRNKYLVRNIVHLNRVEAECIIDSLIGKTEKPNYFSEYLFRKDTSKLNNKF